MDHGRMHQMTNNKHQFSNKSTKNSKTTKLANTNSQCAAEINGQPFDQPEEQRAMDHGRMHQMTNNKHQFSNKSTKNSKTTKTLEPRWKRGFSTRKHIVIVDASAMYWRCRYCGMDGYGKKFRLHYHLAGAFHQPKCPSVPKKVSAKARHYVRRKESLKRVKFGQQIPSRPHIVGQSGDELQNISPLRGNRQLPVNGKSNEGVPSSHLEVPKDATRKIRNQIISKDEHNPISSKSFDGNGNCSSKSSRFDQEHFTTTMHARNSSQYHTNSKAGACNTLSNPSQKNVNPLVYHRRKRKDASDSPLTFHKQQRDDSAASPPVFHEQQREETSSPSEPVCLQGQRMQWLLPHKVWEDLKMAGQNMVELANNLSSLTEASCRNLVEKEKESDADELKGAVVSSSEPTNFVESNALVISTSQGVNQSDIFDLDQSNPVDMDQSDPVDVSDIRDSTCNHCDKEARDGSVLTCTKCLLSCRISHTEPPDPSISIESWYCRNCRMDRSIEGDMVMAHYQPSTHYQPHCLLKNCVACDRLEMCSSPKRKDTPNDNSRAMVLNGASSEEDSELPEMDTVGTCKICGNPEEGGKRFLICGHDHCLYKYYHIRCLKSKQIATDFQCDKPCWYCPSCLCRVCLSDKDDDLIILCGGCDEAYHMDCIRPRHTSIPKGQWYCSSCSAKRAKDGIRQYERRVLTPYRKVDKRLQRRKYDDDLTILCDGCDDAYHLYCIRPRRTSIPKGQWYCSSCSAKRAKGEMRRYERRVVKLHRKVDTRLHRKYDGVDLLLCAADMLKADELLVSCTN